MADFEAFAERADETIKELHDELFSPISADDALNRITIIESLCMNCHENGETRLLLTQIPYFRNVIIMSFECSHCHYKNNEIQPANELGEKAVRYELKVDPTNEEATKKDLNRQVIKSETAVVQIPEVDFEIPAKNKKGEINTIEGILKHCADAIYSSYLQSPAEDSDPKALEKLQSVVEGLNSFANGTAPFTFILDDVGGNSFVENPYVPSHDPRLGVTFYKRTNEQTTDLGYLVEENKVENEQFNAAAASVGHTGEKKEEAPAPTPAPAPEDGAWTEKKKKYDAAVYHMKAKQGGRIKHDDYKMMVDKRVESKLDIFFDVKTKAVVFPGMCWSCQRQAETRMAITEIPYFKEIVLMVTDCAFCGCKDTEVKPGGAISEKARKITLKVQGPDDFKRDVMKADTAGVTIPEIDLELVPGTLGGKYTTLEGLMDTIKEQLVKINPFAVGDSAESDTKCTFLKFVDKFTELQNQHTPFTLILDDPLGNSYIENLRAPDVDPQLTVEDYERTWDQNEELGINDMRVGDDHGHHEQASTTSSTPNTESS